MLERETSEALDGDISDSIQYWHAHAETMAKAAVKGWEIAPKALPSLVVLPSYPTDPIPYSNQTCLELMRASLDFYSWVRNTANNPRVFADKEAQETQDKKKS